MGFLRKGPKPLKVDLRNVYPDNLVGFVSCVAGYSESLLTDPPFVCSHWSSTGSGSVCETSEGRRLPFVPSRKGEVDLSLYTSGFWGSGVEPVPHLWLLEQDAGSVQGVCVDVQKERVERFCRRLVTELDAGSPPDVLSVSFRSWLGDVPRLVHPVPLPEGLVVGFGLAVDRLVAERFLFPDQAERVKGTLGGMWESLGSSYRVVSGVAAELGSVVEGLVAAANRVERESMVGGSGELGDVLGSAKDRVEGVLGVLSGWSFRGVTVWEGPVSEVTGLLDDQFGRLEVSVRVESERERERARVLRQMLRYPC